MGGAFPADALPELSRGLTFLQAAQRAMPRTLGDRVYSAAMNDLMKIAITCRMAFHRDDGSALHRLNIRTCVGVFRALDEHWYSSACRHGGTYPAMWEKHHSSKPWIAPRVFTGSVLDGLHLNRVAPHMALLLPGDDVDLDAPRFEDQQVWHCTSIDRRADTITLCRYWLTDKKRLVLLHEGQPYRRQMIDRAAWAALFPPEPAALCAATDPRAVAQGGSAACR